MAFCHSSSRLGDKKYCISSNSNLICCWWNFLRMSPHVVLAKMLDYKLELIQFHYYIIFQINTLEKGMNTFIPLLWVKIVSLMFFYKERFTIKYIYKLEFQFHYYIIFQTNTLGKGTNTFIPFAMDYNSITAVLLQG